VESSCTTVSGRAIEALAQIISTPEEIEHLRLATITVLRRMSPRSYMPLAALLGTLDLQARTAAHLALVSMGNDEHVFPDDALVARWLQDLASQPASAAPRAMNALIEPLVHLPDFDMAQVWDEVSQIDPFSPNDPNALVLVGVPDRRFGLAWDEWWGILRRIGREAVPALMRALAHDPSEQAAWLVYTLIREQGNQWPITELARAVRYDQTANIAIEKLLALAPWHAPAIVSSLTDPRLVGDLGGAPVTWYSWGKQLALLLDALIDRLSHSDAAVRRNTLVLLCLLSDKRMIPSLLSTLADLDEAVRTRAAHKLADTILAKHLQVEDALPTLIRALADPVDEVRSKAAAALGAFGDDRSVTALVAALADPAVVVARRAAWSLGRIKAVESLIVAIGHPVAEVRAAAIECINDDRALEPIIAALRDPVDDVRGKAAWRLAEKYHDARALEPLLTLLCDPTASFGTRLGARQALIRLHDRRAIAPLAAALDSPVADVRVAAVEALGELGAREVIPQLVAALADPNAGVRHRIIDVLKAVGNRRAIAGLCAALCDPDHNVRVRAEAALREFLSLRLLWPLLRCVMRERDSAVRRRLRITAIRVLLGWKPR
jgi:HEAT repeat protein